MLGISWAAWTETPQPWMLRIKKTQRASDFLRWCFVSHILPAQIKESKHSKHPEVYNSLHRERMGRLHVRGSWLHLHCCLLRGVHLWGGSAEWSQVWARFCYYLSLVRLPHGDFFDDFFRWFSIFLVLFYQWLSGVWSRLCPIVQMIKMVPTFWGRPAAQIQRKACLCNVVQAGRRLRWFMVCGGVSQSIPAKAPSMRHFVWRRV